MVLSRHTRYASHHRVGTLGMTRFLTWCIQPMLEPKSLIAAAHPSGCHTYLFHPLPTSTPSYSSKLSLPTRSPSLHAQMMLVHTQQSHTSPTSIYMCIPHFLRHVHAGCGMQTFGNETTKSLNLFIYVCMRHAGAVPCECSWCRHSRSYV